MEFDQRPLSSLAVSSVVLAVLSMSAMLLLNLWPLAPLGAAAAGLGLWQCRRFDLAGARWALAALVMSLSMLIAAPAWHLHLYRSECAAGHLRLDFAKVMRGPQPSIEKLIGQQVCVKGHAGFEREPEGLKAFALSISGGDLIGGEFLGVLLADGVTWDWDGKPVSVSGTLVRNPHPDTKAPLLLIQATVRPVRTSFDLADRSKSGC